MFVDSVYGMTYGESATGQISRRSLTHLLQIQIMILTLTGLTTGEVIHGLTTDGTSLIALTNNDAGERRLRFINFR